MSLTISIAMTTYNGAKYVAEQLASFASQTVLPNEVIVVDDGSTDGTRDIVKAFAAKAPFPVRLTTYEEYLGVKAKFQIAAELCKSDIIAFADQDDVWLPKKLETCLEKFADQNVLLTYHNATVTNGVLEPIGSMSYQGAPQALNPAGSLDPWLFGNGFTLVFRRELLKFGKYWPQSTDINKPHQRESHDLWFFFLASSLGNIAYIKEPLALYRQHGGNMYGWAKPGRTSIRNYFYNLLHTKKNGFYGRRMTSRHRAEILEELAKDLANIDQLSLALKAAIGYRKLENCYRLRHEMYESSSFLFKLKQLFLLIKCGAYRSRLQWGVGRKAILRDIMRGVIFPVRQTSADATSTAE